MKRNEEISIREAAGLLEVHEDTVRAWCKAAVAGEASKLKGAVRRNAVGWYFIKRKHVVDLADQVARGLAEYA